MPEGKRTNIIPKIIINVLVILIPITLVLYIFVFLKNDNGDNGPTPGPTPTSGATIETEVIVSATIGVKGGTIEVTDSTSPLKGTKIEIPEGALDVDSTLNIGKIQTELTISDRFRSLSPVISLSPSGTVFNEPIKIYIYYDETGVQNEEDITAGIFNEITSSWDIAYINSINTQANYIIIETIHFSLVEAILPRVGLDGDLDTGFRPSKDGFIIKNPSTSKYPKGCCASMAGFAQWYYNTRQQHKYGDLEKRVCEQQAIEIIEALQDSLPLKYLHIDLPLIKDIVTAATLKIGLALDSTQIILLGKNGVSVHRALVYRYYDGFFYVYDSNYPKDDNIRIHFDGSKFEFEREDLKQRYDDFQSTAACRFDTQTKCERILKEKKNIFEAAILRDEKPIDGSAIDDTRPFISAWLESPTTKIDLHSIVVKMDNTVISCDVETITDKLVLISYKPENDLSAGEHSITVTSVDINGIKAKQKDWKFVIGGETWCFTFAPKLPVIYLYLNPIEIYYFKDEDGYPVAGGMDIDLGMIPGVIWTPQIEDEKCISVARKKSADGSQEIISSTFTFLHPQTGSEITADLHGTITGYNVTFSVNYHIPIDLQHYSVPFSINDCMTDWNGTIEYSLPELITTSFEGLIADNFITGTFSEVIAGPIAVWKFRAKNYACAWGTSREEMTFDGLLEYIYSNLREQGDFQVIIKQQTTATAEP